MSSAEIFYPECQALRKEAVPNRNRCLLQILLGVFIVLFEILIGIHQYCVCELKKGADAHANLGFFASDILKKMPQFRL